MHWQILRWPFRIPALFALGIYLLVAVAFTAFAGFNFWVAVLVLSLGLPVWYAVIGQLSLYAAKLLSQAAAGLFDEPIESETDINPFQQSLALKLFLAHGVIFIILFYNGPALNGLLLLPAALFPLLWLSVVFDDSLLGGFHPKKAGQILAGLNIFYPAAMLLISGSVGYLHYSLLYASHPLHLLASAVLFLYGNVLFGALLYAQRRSLNLHTRKSPEQARAIELAAEQKALDQLFHEIHTHIRNGSYGTAIAKLEAFIAEDSQALDPLMHQRLITFQDERLRLEHAVRYLQRLVARGEAKKGWTLMKECLALDERFRPPGDDTLIALTRAAGREDAGLVSAVLKDFHQAYPDSTLIPDAQFRRARICIELLRDGDTGMALLKGIAADYPEFAAGDAYQRYRQRLKVR